MPRESWNPHPDSQQEMPGTLTLVWLCLGNGTVGRARKCTSLPSGFWEEGDRRDREPVKGAHAGSPYLVDAELPLKAAAGPIVQRDLHGVVNVPHLMPAHLILYVQPDHCRGKGRRESQTPIAVGVGPALSSLDAHPPSTPWTWGAPSHLGVHSLGPRATERKAADRRGGEG